MNGRRFSQTAVLTGACCLLLVVTWEARAQTVGSTEQLVQAAAKNRTVYVLGTSGEVTKGRLTGLTDGTLLVRVHDQPRRIPLDDVVRVESRDSTRNGALIGGFIALALWFIPMYAEGERCDAACAPWGAYTFGVGAGIGALVDLGIPGRTTLYSRGSTGGLPARGALGRPAFAIGWRF